MTGTLARIHLETKAHMRTLASRSFLALAPLFVTLLPSTLMGQGPRVSGGSAIGVSIGRLIVGDGSVGLVSFGFSKLYPHRPGLDFALGANLWQPDLGVLSADVGAVTPIYMAPQGIVALRGGITGIVVGSSDDAGALIGFFFGPSVLLPLFGPVGPGVRLDATPRLYLHQDRLLPALALSVGMTSVPIRW